MALRGGFAFWKPGAAAPDVPVENDGGVVAVHNPLASLPLAIQQRSLPIWEQRVAILQALETNGVLVVVAETGSGKSTQLPQYLHHAGWTAGGRQIAITQPRRVAAASLAARVAEEMGVPLGGAVGYAARFEDVTSDATVIRYVTDGLLLRELAADPLLRRYSVVMLDEAHERTLATDLLAGLLKRARRSRPELRIIISSATLEAERFAAFFDQHAEDAALTAFAARLAGPAAAAPLAASSTSASAAAAADGGIGAGAGTALATGGAGARLTRRGDWAVVARAAAAVEEDGDDEDEEGGRMISVRPAAKRPHLRSMPRTAAASASSAAAVAAAEPSAAIDANHLAVKGAGNASEGAGAETDADIVFAGLDSDEEQELLGRMASSAATASTPAPLLASAVASAGHFDAAEGPVPGPAGISTDAPLRPSAESTPTHLPAAGSRAATPPHAAAGAGSVREATAAALRAAAAAAGSLLLADGAESAVPDEADVEHSSAAGRPAADAAVARSRSPVDRQQEGAAGRHDQRVRDSRDDDCDVCRRHSRRDRSASRPRRRERRKEGRSSRSRSRSNGRSRRDRKNSRRYSRSHSRSRDRHHRNRDRDRDRGRQHRDHRKRHRSRSRSRSESRSRRDRRHHDGSRDHRQDASRDRRKDEGSRARRPRSTSRSSSSRSSSREERDRRRSSSHAARRDDADASVEAAGRAAYTIVPQPVVSTVVAPAVAYAARFCGVSSAADGAAAQGARAAIAPVASAGAVAAAEPAPPAKRSRWDASASASASVSAPSASASASAPASAALSAAAASHGATAVASEGAAPAGRLESASATAAAPQSWGAGAAPDLKRVAVLVVPGRTFPVRLLHTQRPVPDFVDAAAEAALAVHAHEGPGDILVFLPGVEDIDRCCQLIADRLLRALGLAGDDDDDAYAGGYGGSGGARAGKRKPAASAADLSDRQQLVIAPLHASLPKDAQMAALEPARLGKDGLPLRKVVVATNVAEASVTLPGVRYVVDSGLAKLPVFDPVTGVDALLTLPISQASARQRAGRAGRVRSGVCYRLYTENDYAALPARTPPEILRCSLGPAVLQMLALGVADPASFDYIDPPLPATLIRALEQLYALGALTRTMALTRPIGQCMASLPCEPPAARMLLASLSMGCAELALMAAALAQVGIGHIFRGWRPGASRGQLAAADEIVSQFAVAEGDVLTWVRAFLAWEGSGRSAEWARERQLNQSALLKAAEVRRQLRRSLEVLAAREQRSAATSAGGGSAGSSGGISMSSSGASGSFASAAANSKSSSSSSSSASAPSSACDAQLSDVASWSLGTSPDVREDDAAVIIRRCVVAGYFWNAARLAPDGRSYITLRDGRAAQLHPLSVLARFGITPQWVVFEEAVWTSALFLRGVTAVKASWLLEAAPHVYLQRGGYDPGDYLSKASLAAAEADGETAAGAAAAAASAAGGAGAPSSSGAAGIAGRIAYQTKAERQAAREAEAAAAAAAAKAAIDPLAALPRTARPDTSTVGSFSLGRITTGPLGPGHGGKSTRTAGSVAAMIGQLFDTGGGGWGAGASSGSGGGPRGQRKQRGDGL